MVQTLKIPPISKMLGVLELGTNSLKLHPYSMDGEVHEPIRVEWEVGFEVYSKGRFSSSTIQNAVEQVKKILGDRRDGELEDVFGVATGVFEDAENTSELLDQLDRDLDVPVRVLTGAEQARLLFLGFRERVSERPAMVFDLGCGRLEKVYLGGGNLYLHDSLPLGVILLHHHACFSYS